MKRKITGFPKDFYGVVPLRPIKQKVLGTLMGKDPLWRILKSFQSSMIAIR